MPNFAKNCRSTVIPCLRYRDAHAAIDWLCRAFGFEKHAVHANAEGSIAHAQLTFGNGMVMLGSVAETPYSKLIKQPDEVGTANTQSPYIVVADADAVYALAKEAGAEIVFEIEDQPYGGRAFTCRDLEGHLWSIGSYDPWETGPTS